MSYTPGRTLIVMPAFNEEQAVGGVVREVLGAVPFADVLVVNDGSRDGTAAEAAAAGAIVATLPFNLGVGGAMRLGFHYAIANRYDNVVQLDSDGQHNPAHVAKLVSGLTDADIVIGARFAGEGEYRVTGPRRWAMVLLSSVLSRITSTKLTDTTSGFKAMGPRAVRTFASHYPAEYLGDTIEALVIAARAHLTVTQLPVAMRERAGGVPSQTPFKSALYLGRAFLALSMALLRPVRSYEIETSAH